MSEPVKLELCYRHRGDTVRIPVGEGNIRIGRRSRCEVWLAHRSVSKIHAFLARDGDTVTVEDSQSHNGTFVNDQRIRAPAVVRPGDAIRIGRYRLHLLYAGAPVPDPVEAAPPRPRWDPTALVLAAILTALVGLAAGAVLKGVLWTPPRTTEEASGGAAEQPASADALRDGADAWLRGDLGEAKTFLRTSEAPAAKALLDVVDAELADLERDPREVDWSERAVLFQRLLRSDPPPNVKLRASEALNAIERGQPPPPR